MFKKITLFLIILCFSALWAFGNAPQKYESTKSRNMSPCILEDLDSVGPPIEGILPVSKPLNTDDPIGDVFLFGHTWNDVQHNASCGRQIQVDDMGWVHVAWMNGLNEGAAYRHIFYQLMNDMDQLIFTTGELGVQVDQSTKSGYTVLELYPDNRAMPAFHQLSAGSALYHSAMGFDYFPQTGAFFTLDLPWVYDLSGNDLKVEWPHMDCDIDGNFHIVSTHNPPSGTLHDIYYCKGVYDPLGFTIDYQDQFGNPQQELFENVTIVSTEVACSPVSNKVAIGWPQWAATEPDTGQYDNDLVYVVSEDGISFDWANPVNVTNFIPPDSTLLPDTIDANKDTIRVYPDISLIYDYDDVLHAFFTTRGYFATTGTISTGNSFIWHWDEEQQVFSLVASGWFENGVYSPGAWNTYVSRASAAIDEETGEIYCMYLRYFQPIESGHHPYMVGDTTDFSAAGFPNGEIWMTKSVDNGWSWSEGLNVTNTYSPDAAAGDCQSEVTPSMAPDISNGSCHIFYILDKDAGSVFQTEGTWSYNDAIYHRVPVTAIPDEPVIPPYPLHIDSTGFPFPVSVAGAVELTPDIFTLEQNHPNPFNPATSIRYSLPADADISLKVFDVQGREAAVLFEGIQKAGQHHLEFDASHLSSGIYFYRLNTGGVSVTKKMILMK